MVPTPEAIGLFLCEKIIIEEKTKNVSLINHFLSLSVESFPAEPIPFVAFASVTGGLGEGTIELVVTRLDTGEDVGTLQNKVTYGDRLGIHNAIFRINALSFPAAGWYEFMLLIDGDPVARRRLRVYERKAGSP